MSLTADARKAHPDLARQNLLMTRALELVQAGDLESAQGLLAQDDEAGDGSLSLGHVFRLYQDELQSQAQQLRDSQQRAEQALAWFANLFRTLPVAALLVDDQGLVTDANRRALDALDLDEVARQVPVLLRRLMATPQAELQLSAALKAVQQTMEVALAKMPLRTMTGRTLVVDLCLTSLPPRAGESSAAMTLCLLTDRTAQAEAEQARAAAAEAEHQRDLAQAAALAKAQLLSRLSHELRTPLNAVIGFSHLLLTTPDAVAPDHQRRVRLIQEAGQHLLDLVEDVLQLNRSGADRHGLMTQPVRLRELAEEVLALQQPQVDARQLRVTLQDLQPGATLVQALADPRRVREVLTNLVSNAVKYNRHGGELALRFGWQGQQAIVQVCDSGIGLTEEQRAHLFEPFNRLGAERGSESGHGLGLSIALAQAQAMGGSIEVSSTPGQGSCFTLTLPGAQG